MTLKIEITVMAPEGESPDCKRCVDTPTRQNRPAYGQTCWTCGVTNTHGRKSQPQAPPENLGVKVHLFAMAARSHHRAREHLKSFRDCVSEDCPLWHAIMDNAKPLAM